MSSNPTPQHSLGCDQELHGGFPASHMCREEPGLAGAWSCTVDFLSARRAGWKCSVLRGRNSQTGREQPGAAKTTGIFGLPSPCCPSRGFQAASMASRAHLIHNKKSQPHLWPSTPDQPAERVGRPPDSRWRLPALRKPCSCGGPLAGAPLPSTELPVGWQEFSGLTPTELTPNTAPLDDGRDTQ